MGSSCKRKTLHLHEMKGFELLLHTEQTVPKELSKNNLDFSLVFPAKSPGLEMDDS